ncbi:MAG: MarR family winged helix-turn-helix transcriptional regulator [Methanobacterium sp.]
MKKSDITHEYTFKIMSIFVRINKKFNELESMSINIGNGENLFPSELHVLDAVGNNYANTVTNLSKKFGITKGGVSQVVNKLFDKGFLYKERKSDSGKEIELYPTEKGWKAFKIMDDLHKQMEDQFFINIGAVESEKIDSFIEVMEKIEKFIDTFLKYET